MHETGSVLVSLVERIRAKLDLSTTKYDDAYIVQHVIMPEMMNVWSRISLTFSNPILIRHRITLTEGQRYYYLPPNVGEIWQIVRYDDNGRVYEEFDPLDRRAPIGPGWAIEGNMLVVEPEYNIQTGAWDVLYMPSGDFWPHYAKGGFIGSHTQTSTASDSSESDATSTLSVDSGPTLGLVDRRPNAYAGAVLRVLRTADGSNTIIEERIIESYDVEAGEITVRLPFDHYQDQDPVWYEITHVGMQCLVQAVAMSAAMNLGVDIDMSQRKAQQIQLEYRKALKTASDIMTHMNQRSPKHFARYTRYNDNRGMWFLS